MEREWGNVENQSLSISSCSLHFLFISSFSLHFLILSPFPRSPAARLQRVVTPWVTFAHFLGQETVQKNTNHISITLLNDAMSRGNIKSRGNILEFVVLWSCTVFSNIIIQFIDASSICSSRSYNVSLSIHLKPIYPCRAINGKNSTIVPSYRVHSLSYLWLTWSFAPFRRLGRVTHALVIG